MTSPNEYELIRAALVNRSAREKLREAANTVAHTEIKRFMTHWNIGEEVEEQLIEAGLSTFNQAFHLYMKNGSAHEGVSFLQYFTWWIRQGAARRARELGKLAA